MATSQAPPRPWRLQGYKASETRCGIVLDSLPVQDYTTMIHLKDKSQPPKPGSDQEPATGAHRPVFPDLGDPNQWRDLPNLGDPSRWPARLDLEDPDRWRDLPDLGDPDRWRDD